MAQITKGFIEVMFAYHAEDKYFPMASYEQEQLARAWLERVALRAEIAELENKLESLQQYNFDRS